MSILKRFGAGGSVSCGSLRLRATTVVFVLALTVATLSACGEGDEQEHVQTPQCLFPISDRNCDGIPDLSQGGGTFYRPNSPPPTGPVTIPESYGSPPNYSVPTAPVALPTTTAPYEDDYDRDGLRQSVDPNDYDSDSDNDFIGDAEDPRPLDKENDGLNDTRDPNPFEKDTNSDNIPDGRDSAPDIG